MSYSSATVLYNQRRCTPSVSNCYFELHPFLDRVLFPCLDPGAASGCVLMHYGRRGHEEDPCSHSAATNERRPSRWRCMADKAEGGVPKSHQGQCTNESDEYQMS